MDLKEGWEKKALIGVAVIVLVIIVYAYFVPFSGTPDNITPNNPTSPSPVVPVQYSMHASNNSNSNSSTNVNNSASIINITKTAYPDYTIGTPAYQNSVNVNGTTYNNVWVVPITKPNNPSITVYVDYTGRIVLRV